MSQESKQVGRGVCSRRPDRGPIWLCSSVQRTVMEDKLRSHTLPRVKGRVKEVVAGQRPDRIVFWKEFLYLV